MGPVREANELTSDYRFRYARYCMRWVAGLGLPMLFALLWAPSVSRSPVPFLSMFFNFGLPIGFGAALIAMLGFLVGGAWSRFAEHSMTNARLLERIKMTVLSALLVPVCLFALYLSVNGLLNEVVHAFGKNTRHLLAWSTQPVWFTVNVIIWAAIGIGGLVYVVRKLRAVYAA